MLWILQFLVVALSSHLIFDYERSNSYTYLSHNQQKPAASLIVYTTGAYHDPEPRFPPVDVIPGQEEIELAKQQECALQMACVAQKGAVTLSKPLVPGKNDCLHEKMVSLKSKKAVNANDNSDFYAWDHVFKKISSEGKTVCANLLKEAEATKSGQKVFKVSAMNFTADIAPDWENTKTVTELLTTIKTAVGSNVDVIDLHKCGVPNPALTLCTFLTAICGLLEKKGGGFSRVKFFSAAFGGNFRRKR